MAARQQPHLSVPDAGLLVLVTALLCGSGVSATDRPVIGILAQGTYGQFAEYGRMYVAASYVKFVEMAGGRAVPVFNNLTTVAAANLFSQLNGVLMPGGGANLTDSGYALNSRVAVSASMDGSQQGDHFPVWATCRGMEELVAMFSSPDLMTAFDSSNISLPLALTKAAATSRMLGSCPGEVLGWLQTEPLTANFHRLGISPAKFEADPSLTSAFDVLATSRDRSGLEFVSLLEARDFPVFSSIFHPEKSVFEWGDIYAINHSAHAVKAAQYLADFFLQEARASTHIFPTAGGVSDSFFYNFEPMYTGREGFMFEQCYFF